MASRYPKARNPFEEEDIDDETFLQNSRRSASTYSQNSFDNQMQSFQERKKAIEERTITSTQQSLSVLRDSEQIGIATAEELMRQREKLEKTDKQLDDINNTLRFSQKHINGIKSVFSSLKNYMSGKVDKSPTTSGTAPGDTVKESPSNGSLEDKLSTYDRYDQHPSTRLRGNDYSASHSQTYANATSGSADFSARLDANLQEMCDNISRLKGLAGDLGQEIDYQNDLIDNITYKAENADMTIQKQNKDMVKIMKK